MKKKKAEDSQAVLLLTYRSNEEAEKVLCLLQEAGIPAFIESYYSNLILGSVVDVGGVRLMVENSRAKEAVELLRQHGEEVPHPEDSTVGRLSRFYEKSPLLRKVSKKYRLGVILLLLVLLLFLVVSLVYLFMESLG